MGRVGIFAGTFDPVHNGHIAFAAAAMDICQLTTVAFLPEPHPRGKLHVTPLKHRTAMLQLVARQQPHYMVLQLDDPRFSVARTLPKLRDYFAGDELWLLLGSDVAAHLPDWEGAETLYATVKLAVGQRAGDTMPVLPGAVAVPTTQAHVAASNIRHGLSQDVTPDVRAYIATHTLYGMAAA